MRYIIENEELVVRIRLNICNTCGKFMIPLFEHVPQHIEHEANKRGIQKEWYKKLGMCMSCYMSGGYQEQCGICNRQLIYPNDFAYKLQFYPKDDDTYEEYICKECIYQSPQSVIDRIVLADEVTEAGRNDE